MYVIRRIPSDSSAPAGIVRSPHPCPPCSGWDRTQVNKLISVDCSFKGRVLPVRAARTEVAPRDPTWGQGCPRGLPSYMSSGESPVTVLLPLASSDRRTHALPARAGIGPKSISRFPWMVASRAAACPYGQPVPRWRQVTPRGARAARAGCPHIYHPENPQWQFRSRRHRQIAAPMPSLLGLGSDPSQ